MPLDKNRQFLDFEKPIKELFDEIEKLKQTAEKTKVDLSEAYFGPAPKPSGGAPAGK